jgi:hypothetical protein
LSHQSVVGLRVRQTAAHSLGNGSVVCRNGYVRIGVAESRYESVGNRYLLKL